MWVKICGTTTLDDALMASELGANAVGFVFAPSRRQVDAESVARIVAGLPGSVEAVGVFPAWDAERIAATVLSSGVTTVQLHGGYDPALTRRLEDRFGGGVRIIEVMHWALGAEGSGERPPGERVLVDSKVGSESGGTGIPFAWEAARELFASGERMILAGGLRPENVAQAIATLEPWGVDVVSGVEAAPGSKHRTRMERFFAELRAGQSVPAKTERD